MFNFIRVLSLVQGSGWEFLCFLLHTIRLQVRERRRGWRGPTVKQGLAGCKAPTWPVVRARKPNSLALPAGVREPNQSAAPGLARSDEGTRACGVQGANMNGRPALFKAHCWRNPPVEQGLAGCKAPTCPVTRGRNRNRKRAAAAALFISLPSSRFIPPKMQFSIGSL